MSKLCDSPLTHHSSIRPFFQTFLQLSLKQKIKTYHYIFLKLGFDVSSNDGLGSDFILNRGLPGFSDGPNSVRSSMFDRLKPKIGFFWFRLPIDEHVRVRSMFEK